MNAILGNLTIYVAISIGGVITVSLGLSLATLKAKVGISHTQGSITRGYELGGDGAGAYRSLTYGNMLQTQVKVNDDGTASVDKVLSLKACYKKWQLCGKAGVKVRVVDNSGEKRKPAQRSWPLYDGSFKSNALRPEFSLSSPEVNEQSKIIQQALNQSRIIRPSVGTSLLQSVAQAEQNEWARKLGQQVYSSSK